MSFLALRVVALLIVSKAAVCAPTVATSTGVAASNSPFSAKESACLANSTILWPQDGKCYPLLQAGPPCREGQWLALNDNTWAPECKACRCCTEQTKKVFWAKDGRCHVGTDASLCPLGSRPITHFTGEGVCACKDGYARLARSSSRECHQLFNSTVCPQGKYLVLLNYTSSNDEEKADCRVNPCRVKNQAPWLEPGGDGRCYTLGTQGPCQEVEHLFAVLAENPHLTGCTSYGYASFTAPNRCTMGAGGRCVTQVTFSTAASSQAPNRLKAFLSKKKTRLRSQQEEGGEGEEDLEEVTTAAAETATTTVSRPGGVAELVQSSNNAWTWSRG